MFLRGVLATFDSSRRRERLARVGSGSGSREENTAADTHEGAGREGGQGVNDK